MRNKVLSSLSADESNNDESTTVEPGLLNTSSQAFFCNATEYLKGGRLNSNCIIDQPRHRADPNPLIRARLAR